MKDQIKGGIKKDLQKKDEQIQLLRSEYENMKTKNDQLNEYI